MEANTARSRQQGNDFRLKVIHIDKSGAGVNYPFTGNAVRSICHKMDVPLETVTIINPEI